MKRILLVLLSSALCPLSSVLAQAPALINYQGRLMDGTNLVNGTVGLSLRLYSAPVGGSPIYEDSNSVAVADGLYSTFLGDNTVVGSIATALATTNVYVEVAVNGVTLSPRERVVSVPFALRTDATAITNFVKRTGDAMSGGLLIDIGTNSTDAARFLSGLPGGTWFVLRNTNSTGAQFDFAATGSGNSEGPGKLLVRRNSSSIMTISTNGYMGVGTTDPTAMLHVKGGTIRGDGGSTEYQTCILTSDSPVGTWFVLHNGTTNGTRHDIISSGSGNGEGAGKLLVRRNLITAMTISTNGYIGVGTTDPDAPLHIVGTNAFPHLRVAAAGSAPYGAFLSLDATATTNGNNYHFFATGNGAGEGQGKLIIQNFSDGLNLMTFASSGAVGVGTLSPTAGLHVASDQPYETFRVNSGVNQGTWIRVANTTANRDWAYVVTGTANLEGAGNLLVRDNTAGAVRMTVLTNGNVGIGTTAPTGLLHVAGNAYATAFLPTSDRNAKENVAPVDEQAVLEKVAALPMSTWSFKTEPGVRHLGPMAQDFHAAFGLGPNDTTIPTVDADGVALAAIQALYTENQELKRRVDALERALQREEEVTGNR